MKKLLIYSLLSMAACGAPPPAHIDPAFQSYVNIFNAAAALRGKAYLRAENTGITIRWAILMPSYAAVCHSGGIPVIEVDPNYWVKVNEWNRETLILHELGHCILNRGHNTVTPYKDRQFKSVMYPVNIVGDYFAHKAAYLDELFNVEDY